MFEKSKWIEYKSESPGDSICTTPAPYIAKTFMLREKPEKAILNIVAVGDAAYFINGKRIPDSLRPTYASDYKKSAIYNVFDITSELCAGKNRLGAILGCFRTKQSVYGFLLPRMLIAELDVIYSDGSFETVVSDESFKGADSHLLFTATLCGERQDARLEIPGWCDAEFNDEKWNNVEVTDLPNIKFRTTDCPPKRIISERKFKEIAPNLFDCGITTSGYAKAKISGKAGNLIKLTYSERLLPDKMHIDSSQMTKGQYPDMFNSDEYILDGTKGKEYNQYMAFHGFRYVEVTGDYDEIELTAVTEHTDIKETAYFECDNDIINKIHFSCVNSVLTCCQDVFVDNPKRDASWVGDTMLSSEVILSEFDSKSVLLETARHCYESMNESGRIPDCVPSCSKWGFGKRFSGPDWGNSVVFQIVFYIYKYFGDIKPFMDFKKNLDRSLEFFAEMAEDDGYIADEEYATGDWSCLHASTEARKDIMSNVYYKWDLEIMAELSSICGYDSKPYKLLAEKIKKAFRARYMPGGRFEEVSVSELITLAARGFFEKMNCPKLQIELSST